jgi:competence protein ComFC
MNKDLRKRDFALKIWLNIVDPISHLVFPNRCLICAEELAKNSQSICSFCFSDLNFTHFEKYQEPTKLDQLFWGRVQLASTFGLLFFEKGKSSQKILHALKYQSNPQVGVAFGKLIGSKIKDVTPYKEIDALIPVPIHPKKEFDRGYNQSEQLAKGIGEILNIDVDTHFLKKKTHTGSQTRKNRFARWDNVVNNFDLRKRSKTYQHIAIVDDVVTTGATIEALVRSIKENYPDLRISIISLAVTT